MGNTGRGGILLLACALVAAPPAFADIYKYTDKHGRVYLTDTPKHSGYKRLVKTWKGWQESKSSVALKDFEKNRAKFSSTIDYYAKQHKLPNSLVHAVVAVESAYDPEAVSRAGAVGLMQLMPETAKRYGVANRTNPAQNVSGGTRYLRDLLDMFNNDLVLALAAYNAGEGAVKRHGNKVPPYPETQRYVAKVLSEYNRNRKAGAVAGR
jgi:soluble lytic murein transglycosylase-like protein